MLADAGDRDAPRHPEQDQVAVRNKTDDNLRTEPGKPMDVKEDDVANGEMFAEYIEWRAKHPSDDLMTQLLNAEFEDERPDANADPTRGPHVHLRDGRSGNETTGRLIGWLAKVLAEHPDQRRAVVEDRSLIPDVIDETLRFEPTGHATARMSPRTSSTTGRLCRRKCDSPAVASANRDPRRYDDPDSLRHPSAGHPAPYFRLRPALLPWSAPRQTRGSGGPGRDSQPVARMGHRLRHIKLAPT